MEQGDQPGGRIFGEQLNVTGFEYGFVADGLKQTHVELRDAGHNGLQVIGGGTGTQSWVKLFAGASSRHRHHQAGIHLYDVQHDGRLLVRDIWYEGDAWSLMNLKGSGEFAYHCGFVAPADPNHLDKTLDWEQDLRRSVAALQFDGFRGKLAFTLVSVNGGTLRVKPPSADLKLYLLGFLTNRTMDFGGAMNGAVKGQVVAEHVKAVPQGAHRPRCRRRHRQGHAGVHPRDADPAPHGEAATAHRPRSERQRRAFLPRVGQWQERRPRAGGAGGKP